MRLYLHWNGYVLLCAKPYRRQADEIGSQISNHKRAIIDPAYTAEPYTVRDGSLDPHEVETVSTGHRRTLAWLKEHAQAQGHSYDKLWVAMQKAVSSSVLAAEKSIVEKWERAWPRGQVNNTRQLILPKVLGVDFQLDAAWKPWLLEVNQQPDILDSLDLLKLRVVRDSCHAADSYNAVIFLLTRTRARGVGRHGTQCCWPSPWMRPSHWRPSAR